MYSISPDGYIRLSSAQLEAIPLTHLISGLDEDGAMAGAGGATTTLITGYTEWVAGDNPAITLGWDWQMTTEGAAVRLLRVGQPRSNLMLLGEGGADLGYQATGSALCVLVDAFGWEQQTLAFIRGRYDGCADEDKKYIHCQE